MSFLLDKTKRTLPRHVGRGPRTQPGGGWEEPGVGDIETASRRYLQGKPQE